MRSDSPGCDDGPEQHHAVPFDHLGQFAVDRANGVVENGRAGPQRLPVPRC